jgi:voltage-gated sodium channel
MLKRILLNDNFILLLIVINALIIVLQNSPGMSLSTYKLFFLIDCLLTVIFVAEVIVKINVFTLKIYFRSGWNIFDFVIISIAAVSLITSFVLMDFYDIGFLLVLRISRVFRIIRSFKFIPRIDELVKGIQRALKASVIVIVALGTYLFILGVVSQSIFQEMSPDYFGTPLRSIYSVFRIFTIEGWFEIPDALADTVSGSRSVFITIYFAMVMFTGGILGISLVNSIFVDAMVADNNDPLEGKIDLLSAQIMDLQKRIESLTQNNKKDGY